MGAIDRMVGTMVAAMVAIGTMVAIVGGTCVGAARRESGRDGANGESLGDHRTNATRLPLVPGDHRENLV